MPDVNSIPFRQADTNGHYRSKQLPYDQSDFLLMLGMPAVLGDVQGPAGATVNQVALFADSTGKKLAAASQTGLAKLATGTLSTVAAPAGAVVGTTDVQTLTNKTLNGCTYNGMTGLTKADVGLANVDNTSDVNKPVSTAQAAAIALKQDLSAKGTVNGYASLDGSGKVPASQLPATAAAVTSVNARTGVVVLDKPDVNLSNVDNTSDVNKPVSTATQTALNLKEDKANKGVANGYASLDASTKVPMAQIPDALVGASQYKGTWNATTNSPSITTGSAPGKTGWYYSVNVAGTTTVDGISSWAVGDQIISNGTVWQKIPNANAVNSVNGQTGTVVLTKADVGLGNVDNTSDANKPVSTAQQTALNLKEDKANKGVASGYAGLDGAGKVPAAQLPTPLVSSVNSQTGAVVLTKADVGLGNVDNTSDATKNAAVATLTNKTLTSPVINGGTLNSVALSTPTGLTKADVGLGNVDNTSDATKNAAVATLTNKTLNSPVINTPTGIVKADVGLGNVDNTSDATKNSAVATLTNKTINGANNTLTVRLDTSDTINNLPVTKLNSGTGANSGSFWRGDGQWAPPAGGGDVVGPSLSVDGELPLLSGTSGKVLKRCNLSGFVKAVPSGAATSQTLIAGADIAAGAVVAATIDPAMITGQTEKTTLCDPEDLFLIVDKPTGLLRCIRSRRAGRLGYGQLGGLTMANGTDTVNDISIGPGECRDDTNVADILLGSTLVKQLDVAWAAGTNAGGRDTGAIADATYHLFMIRNPTTGAVDALFSQSVSAPTMPSGFTQKRRIGSFVRQIAAWGGLIPFTQLGNYFEMSSPTSDHTGASVTANGLFYANLWLKSMPTGVKMLADFDAQLSCTVANASLTLWDPDVVTPARPNICSQVANILVMGRYNIWTDTSGRVRGQASAVAGTYTSAYGTAGYWDYRTVP